MDNEKHIMVIGCGSTEIIEVALERLTDKLKDRAIGIHLVQPDIGIDRLKEIALTFQNTNHEVLVVSDGLDIAKDLIPKQDFTESLHPNIPNLIDNIIKDAQHFRDDFNITYEVDYMKPSVNPHDRDSSKYSKKYKYKK
jgi:hypothetical protein